jgi:phosphatidylinositol alpha-1,6-mannosyltransferase
MGGIENLMGGLVSALRAEGRKVHVLADRARGKGQIETVPDYPLERFGGPRPLRRWLKMRRAKALLGSSTITAVFADSYKSIEYLPPLHIPVVVLAHGMEFPQNPSARKHKRIAASFAKASTVIASSNFTARLLGNYLSPANHPVVINPPIGPQPAASGAMRTRLADWLGGHTPVLLTLSRLEPRKGIDQVIRALPDLLPRHPGLVYLVAGGGDDADRLKQLVSALDLADHVRFMGRVDDDMKAALFERATVFAMPVRREGSSVEGFGISYCEAAWYGVPSLAGSDGGAVDAVHDGVTGLVCDGANPHSVSQALANFLGDDELRQRLGVAARQRAHGELQFSRSIKTYIGFLEVSCDPQSGLESDQG